MMVAPDYTANTGARVNIDKCTLNITKPVEFAATNT